jgi:type IV pilus assembly protein PilA
MNGVSASAGAWNGGFVTTKYVTSVVIGPTDGVITITYDATAIPQLASKNVITLSPFVGGAALAAGATGNIDWACASATADTAANASPAMKVTAPSAGVPAKYVPTQCK